MELCKQEEMQVIFGTPTATPPAWLTEKYPEVLNCRQDGVPYRHGARRHYNYNSPKYRELSARIVEKLAQHYGKHPAIVGWQIDNELNCEVDEFYSEADSVAFRNFVKEKYKSFCFIDDINEIVHRNSGKISFKIKAQVGRFVSIFNRYNGEDVLCKDGYIRNSNEKGIEILKVWDRDEVIALLEKMHQKVITECEANGYDTEAYSLGNFVQSRTKERRNT